MVTVDTTGLDRLLSGVIAKALDSGAQAGAESTLTIAKATVVVGAIPPHTRDTIAIVNSEPGIREVEAQEAGILIELGTSRMPPRPFLLPAALDEATLNAFANAVRESLK